MEMRPWMIEAAYNYLKASRLLWANHLAVPSLMTGAIGVEILLKSFLVEVDGKSGGIGEKYHFDRKRQNINDGHNLLELFDAIPDDIKVNLNFHKYRRWINDFLSTTFC
jgi:hypothetical protein